MVLQSSWLDSTFRDLTLISPPCEMWCWTSGFLRFLSYTLQNRATCCTPTTEAPIYLSPSLLQTAFSCFVGPESFYGGGDPVEPKCPQAFRSRDWLIAPWLIARLTKQRVVLSHGRSTSLQLPCHGLLAGSPERLH